VTQWTNLTTTHGLFQLEHQLTSEPVKVCADYKSLSMVLYHFMNILYKNYSQFYILQVIFIEVISITVSNTQPTYRTH